jgi:hypothetical protein
MGITGGQPMSEIEKMYENAGVKPDRIVCYRGFDNCIDNDFNCHCHNKKPCKDATKIYPPFTAEKQLFLFQWICKKFEEIYISHTNFEKVQSWEIVYKISVHRNSFEECLCAFINLFWQSLTKEEKQQVKGILE